MHSYRFEQETNALISNHVAAYNFSQIHYGNTALRLIIYYDEKN